MKGIFNKDIVFLFVFVFLILFIGLFNYIVDPYYIFNDKTYHGFNDVKIHKFTNKRTMLYSNIKTHRAGKTVAFTGNCLIYNYGKSKGKIAFFTIPQAKIYEVSDIINNIMTMAPDVKTIYWGLFYDDFCNDFTDDITDKLPELDSKFITLNDIVNLFFSWNTTKYSIETVITSIKNKNSDIKYIYPYREIANKKYSKDVSYESLDKIRDIIKKANENGIKIILYYSPIHISKKIHIYESGVWDNNMEFKRQLASILPYTDYSLINEYNSTPLDENNKYFVDNSHPSSIYNDIIYRDILDNSVGLGIKINKDNVEDVLKSETLQLKSFINNNLSYAEEIKNVKSSDGSKKILLKNE